MTIRRVAAPSSNFRQLLKDAEERYLGAFEDVGSGAVQDFKHLIGCIDGFFDVLIDSKIPPQVKLMDYAKVGADVAEFCRYYERWLGTPLTERLKHEINEILEQALDWWGKQEIYDVMEE